MSDYLPLPPLPPPSSRPTSSLPWTTAPASKLLPLLLSQSLIPHPQGAPRDQTSHIPHTVHIFPSASQCLLIKSRGFPGSPLVKSLYSHCRGHRFDPWQKTKTSQVKKQSHTHTKKKIQTPLLAWPLPSSPAPCTWLPITKLPDRCCKQNMLNSFLCLSVWNILPPPCMAVFFSSFWFEKPSLTILSAIAPSSSVILYPTTLFLFSL